MEGEIDELVAKFCGVTTSNPEQAQFYLESTDWQLEPALQLFFDADPGGTPQQHDHHQTPVAMNLDNYDLTEDSIVDSTPSISESTPEPVAVMAPAAPVQPISTSDRAIRESTTPPAPQPPAPRLRWSLGNYPRGKDAGSTGRRASANSSRAGLVATLGDLGKRNASDGDSEGQEYYTGGEKSGMVVQDPAAKKRHGHRDVEAVLERVRSATLGSHDGPVSEPPRPPAPSPASSRFFTGSSNARSSSTTGTSRQREVQSSVNVADSVPGDEASPAAIVHTVSFWRNGFTVNDGPLRRLDDVSNLPFLESINRSECPRELEPTDRSIPVNVNLVKRMTEDWQAPPEPTYVAFKGVGHTLGSKKPAPSSEEVQAPSATTSNAPRSSRALIVDDARPATSIQLRLADGTRMVARFNTNHTVADIRGFIDLAQPGGPGPYRLQTMGFPPVQLTNPTQTIEGAGLLNAVVIQKG